jgi:magnesium-transporting ATPase (P-type)
MKRTSIPTSSDDLLQAWHTISEQVVFYNLQSSVEGISGSEVQKRREQYGFNTLPSKEPPGLIVIFMRQFANPLIYVLLLSSVVSMLLGEIKDALFIFVVLLSNAAIGAAQEWNAEKSAAALHSLLKIYARVKRDGFVTEIRAEELVPGDIVLVETGLKTPADIRLLQTNNLFIDESLLTGESVSVGKSIAMLQANISLSQRSNMAFAGSTVVSGRGLGIVVATGETTEFGKIAQAVMFSKTSKPPLVVRMEKFARQISVGVLLACLVLGALAIARNMPYAEVFFFAVALAVSAIPEGLPVAITVALSIGTRRMANRHVIVRKLTAVEGLGSCTCIASDKTGTLAINKQTVKILSLPGYGRFHVSGEGYTRGGDLTTDTGQLLDSSSLSHVIELAKTAILCSEAVLEEEDGHWYHHGDAVDVALLALGYKAGLIPQQIREQIPLVGAIPYESEKKYAASFYKDDQGHIQVAVKGALETLLPFCTQMSTDKGIIDIHRQRIERESFWR